MLTKKEITNYKNRIKRCSTSMSVMGSFTLDLEFDSMLKENKAAEIKQIYLACDDNLKKLFYLNHKDILIKTAKALQINVEQKAI